MRGRRSSDPPTPCFLPTDSRQAKHRQAEAGSTGTHAEKGEASPAANELTLTAWDPVSKQPYFKYAAVRLWKVGVGRPLGEAIGTTAGKLVDRAKELVALTGTHTPRRHMADALGLVRDAHTNLAEALESVARHHPGEPGIQATCRHLAELTRENIALLAPVIGVYGESDQTEPGALRKAFFPAARANLFGLLRDLQALYVLTTEADLAILKLAQAAQGIPDQDLLDTCDALAATTKRTSAWLLTQIKHMAPQALTVPAWQVGRR